MTLSPDRDGTPRQAIIQLMPPPFSQGWVGNIRKLAAEENVAVLWATHLVDEVDDADDIVMLAKGRVVDAGSPAELIARSGASDLTDAYSRLTG